MRTVVRLFPVILLLGLLALPARPADPPRRAARRWRWWWASTSIITPISISPNRWNTPRPMRKASPTCSRRPATRSRSFGAKRLPTKPSPSISKSLRKPPGSDGVFLVAFAGHGLQPEGSKEAYFVPYDAKQRLLKPDEKDKQPWDTESLVPLSEVIGHLRRQFGRIAAVVGGCVPQ